MREEIELPESHWNRESIRSERKAKLDALNLTKEQLIERVLDLETALYPFTYTLGSINNESWRGTNVTSKLFPMLGDDNEYLVFEPGGGTKHIKAIPESELHITDYYEHDSIYIKNGSNLDDLFDVLSVHQQAPGAYIGCGSVTMGDVRYAVGIMYPKEKSIPEPSKLFERRRDLKVTGIAFSEDMNLRAAQTIRMDLNWSLCRHIRKFMETNEIKSLSFRYDFALTREDKTP